jgi:hypothetical protein
MATFNFTFDPGTTVQQMLGMEMAGRVWSRYLTDNVTLNLHVGISGDLNSNVIGGALPGMRASQNYLEYRNVLMSGPRSADDNTALNNLSSSASYQASFQFLDNGITQLRIDNKDTLNMTRAVAKAAGIRLSDESTSLDGYILFSNLNNATSNGQAVRWSYDYTRSTAQASNTLDFLSTAIHEIGHVLGFVSGIDQPGWLNIALEGLTSSQNYVDGMRNRLQFINPLDLFRYSPLSQINGGIVDITYGNLGGTKYFSLDKGVTSLNQFASGLDTTASGDGYQASHWKNGTPGIMNPTLSLAQRRDMAAIDLRAMDVIGWDIATTGIGTTIDLSALQTQSRAAIAARAGQSNNITQWINANFTASPTQLVVNRDQAIYTMMQNSVVYDMTRVAAPSSTGWATRQTLAQVFQQRSLFSTVEELDGLVTESLPQVEITGLGHDSPNLSALNAAQGLTTLFQRSDRNLTPMESFEAWSLSCSPMAIVGAATPKTPTMNKSAINNQGPSFSGPLSRSWSYDSGMNSGLWSEPYTLDDETQGNVTSDSLTLDTLRSLNIKVSFEIGIGA